MQLITIATIFAAAVANAQLISPDTVPTDTRDYWCSQQTTQCPLICSQINNGMTATTANECDASTLVYQCVCSNGMSPNSTEYSQTIPYFECTESNNRCVQACGLNNTPCQSACRQDNPCGASDPKHYTITTTATTPYVSPTLAAGESLSSSFAAAAATGSSAPGGGSNGPVSFNGDTSAAGVLKVFAPAVVLGGVVAGFALVL